MMNLVQILTTLFVWLSHKTPVRAQKSAVCFLTRIHQPRILSFAQSLAQNGSEYNLDVFIAIDDKQTNITSVRNISNVAILDVSTPDCLEYGYRKTISLGGPSVEVTSWDKALYYFVVLNQNYSFLWLIEDDVFIPTTRSFLAMHLLYSNISDVLIARNGFNRLGNIYQWLWGMAWGLFVPPWSCSMANVVGLSRRTLDKVDEYVQWRGEVPFHEFFFNTLAIHENLTMRSSLALSSIRYAEYYTYEQLIRKPNNLWHPMKDLSRRDHWREKLLNESSLKWHPVNLTHLLSLCSDQYYKPGENVSEEEKYFEQTVVRFDQMKSFYSRSERFSIHRQIVDVFAKCQQLNASVKILSLLLELADHAYRRPDVFEKELVKEKSAEHRRLENALHRNKETVLELISRNFRRSSLVQQLRADAKNLTILLSKEIQREEKEESRRNEMIANASRYATTTTSSSLLTQLFSNQSKSRFRFRLNDNETNGENLRIHPTKSLIHLFYSSGGEPIGRFVFVLISISIFGLMCFVRLKKLRK